MIINSMIYIFGEVKAFTSVGFPLPTGFLPKGIIISSLFLALHVVRNCYKIL